MKFILKRFLFTVAGLLLIVITSCSSKEKKEGTAISADTAVNELPNMSVKYLNGSQQSARELKGNIILVLFQPDCDHCQREAEQIQKNLNGFNGYQIHFISSGEMKDIETFAKTYQLMDKPNVSFGWTAAENIVNNFGPISAPSLYIYRDGKLIQSFNGEVAIEVVLKYV